MIRSENTRLGTRLYLIDWAEKRILEMFWTPEHVIECDALDKALLRIKKALAVLESYYPSL